jgi:23S rRNA U2552 (ribose-2'-O)-methylase RlmE/FtsJ
MKIYKLSSHEKIINTNDNSNFFKNDTLINSLHQTKCKIDSCNLKKWELAKKYHNDFEYVYTSSNTQKNMCLVLPISRSYFKILEIIYEFNLFQNDKSFSCIAEGPGGFIQSIHDIYKKNKMNINTIYGITLISNDRKIPYWNSNILKNPKNNIQYGTDKTGDIYKLSNALDYIKSHKEKCYLVTSDGGFDFSENYNEQENNCIKLLFCEIFIALHVQELNGTFIIKVFDLLNLKTIQLLYILYLQYSEINFYKPDTSRLSNSEKYIVCKGFTGLNKDISNLMIKVYDDLNLFHLFVPQSFLDEINNFNIKFVDNQKKNINEVLKIVRDHRHIQNKPTNKQINSAKLWCQKYNLELNPNFVFS